MIEVIIGYAIGFVIAVILICVAEGKSIEDVLEVIFR